MEQSLRGHHAGVASFHIRRLIRALTIVFAVAVLGSTRAAAAQCGNGIIDPGEDCDDGGTCIGGSNAGTHCTAETDCVGNGVCLGGTHARAACAGDAACPGGACVHCVPQGGDGCAANCTLESDVPYPLIPGDLDGLNLVPKTSGLSITSDFISIPLPLSGACNGGDNATQSCVSNPDCPGGTCVPSRETLTIGKERDGKIPLVVKVDSVRFAGIIVSTGACGCIRGAVGKTCGGAAFEDDDVTPSLDCTPDYTAGDSLCTAAGKPPCTAVHGEGNTASGEIGCDGLDNINVDYTQDSGGVSGIAGPPMVTFRGSGGPGSAVVLNTIAITAALGSCAGTDPSTYGPDGIYCTPDDPPGGITYVAVTSPAVTGVAQAQVLNANSSDDVNLPPDAPLSAMGAPFNCTALVQGSAAGAGLAQAFPLVHLATVGDDVVAAQFFANGTLPPTPTSTPVAFCIGDCNGRGEVTVSEALAMVNIALGNALPSACPDGVPPGADVDIAAIIQAVSNALSGCRVAPPTPAATPTAAPTPFQVQICQLPVDCIAPLVCVVGARSVPSIGVCLDPNVPACAGFGGVECPLGLVCLALNGCCDLGGFCVPQGEAAAVCASEAAGTFACSELPHGLASRQGSGHDTDNMGQRPLAFWGTARNDGAG